MKTCQGNFSVGKHLRKVIEERSRESGLDSPIPGILIGTSEDDPIERYMLGFYDRQQLPVNDPVALVQVDGLEVLIIQERVLRALDGKTIDIIGNEIAIL